MIAMVMLVPDAREAAPTEDGIWQSYDHSMRHVCAKPPTSLLFL